MIALLPLQKWGGVFLFIYACADAENLICRNERQGRITVRAALAVRRSRSIPDRHEHIPVCLGEVPHQIGRAVDIVH